MVAGRARRLRRGAARELRLERPEARPQRSARVQARVLERRDPRGHLDHELGKLPPGNAKLEGDADAPLAVGDRARAYPAPDGKLTFDKLSSVYLSGNKTRDDAPSHIRIQHTVAPEVAEAWVHMCPAHVYELAGEARRPGLVTVEVTPSNCVQCGAITAKGGRLTPPEGGSGPEYSVM